MDNVYKNKHFHRLLSGKIKTKIKDKVYILYSPTHEILYDSYLLYDEILYDKRFSEWLTEVEAHSTLIKNGFCQFNDKDRLQSLEKEIESYKVQLYLNYINPEKRKTLKRQIKNCNEEFHNITISMHLLDHVTIQGFAESVRNDFVICSTLTDDKNKLLWAEFEKCDINFIERVQQTVSLLSVSELREMARTEPWRSYWAAFKSNCFKSKNLSEEQRTLILFTRMYDGAYESVETPEDRIFEDDDAFDGWMIHIKRKRDREKKEKEFEKHKHLGNKHRDIFIPADSMDHAREIDDLNTISSKMIKKERNAAIMAAGYIDETKLPDVQRDLQMEKRRLYNERYKRK